MTQPCSLWHNRLHGPGRPAGCSATVTEGKPMRILVVDDDPMAGELTGAVLEDIGHEVILAQDGLDAASKLRVDPTIEMIVSDMNMPIMTGIDLFRQLFDTGNTLPFILLTGDEPEGLLKQEPRLDACLIKDFSLDETLPTVIANALRARGKA